MTRIRNFDAKDQSVEKCRAGSVERLLTSHFRAKVSRFPCQFFVPGAFFPTACICIILMFVSWLLEYRKELEKDNVLSVQHKVEEEMSQALIRECPKCKSRFFKIEGM